MTLLPPMHDAVPLLHDFLTHSARLWPDKIALVCADRRTSFAELSDLACRFARALRRNDVNRGDRVLIFAENSVEAVVAFWGALMADAIAVPTNALTKPEKLRWLLDDSGATALVATASLAATFRPASRVVPSLKAVFVIGGPEGDREFPWEIGFETAVRAERTDRLPRRNLDIDLAALVYTSGSRGEPKGVMLSHRNMLSAAASICEYLKLSDEDVVWCALPLAFDYGLYQMIMCVRQGARLVLENAYCLPAELMRVAAAEGVTVIPGMPTLFATLDLLKDPSRWETRRVRTITSTGAPLPRNQIEMLGRLFPTARLYSMYGLTECKRCAYLPPEDLAKKPGSVGIAIPNTELWIVDERDNRLGPNQVGQLVIRGATVMQGYWGNAEETARMLRSGPLPGERVLYTGDLCRLDEDGYLYFVSRMDDIIKSRGNKVAPAEVEAALLAIPGVKEAAVIGVPDPLLGEAVKAFVVPAGDRKLDEAMLIRDCRQRLEGFMVPQRIELIPALPRTTSGKIHKAVLG